MGDVLVLDSSGRPIYVECWQEIARLYYQERLDILVEDETKVLRSQNFEMGMPRVVRLRNWIARNFKKHVGLSRRNLVLRDSIKIGGKLVPVCQYCGCKITADNYSADHVYPRSLGGQSTWNNMVVCCTDCNSKKANKTLKQAVMRLLKTPAEPDPTDPRYTFRLRIKNPHPSWEPWLYWNVELEK